MKLLSLLAALMFALPAQAETQEQATVRAFYSQLTSTMKQGEQLGFSGRYKKLDPVMRAAFDLPLMTKLAVGSSWNEASHQEQADLIAAFSEFSIASYASQFASYHGEQFKVEGESKNADGSVLVQTSLTPKDAAPVSLNYLMRPDQHGKYLIVDVYLNGAISQIATRRAEFSSIARRDGISALVNSLDEKSKQMGPS